MKGSAHRNDILKSFCEFPFDVARDGPRSPLTSLGHNPTQPRTEPGQEPAGDIHGEDGNAITQPIAVDGLWGAGATFHQNR